MSTPNNPQSQGTTRGANGLQPNPEEVNEFHKYDDVDGSPESHHHTLGTDPLQASPGSHSHNGVDSPKIGAENLPKGVPTGAILMWPTATPPEGYLACNGQVVSRTAQAALFAVIGTTYGVGDGSTTFAVPNMQQRFPLGTGAANPIAQTGGAINHTHTNGTETHLHGHTTQHSHTQTQHSHVTSDHSHSTGGHSHSTGGHSHSTGGHDHAVNSHQHRTFNHNHGKTDESLFHDHFTDFFDYAVGGNFRRQFANGNFAGNHGHNIISESVFTFQDGGNFGAGFVGNLGTNDPGGLFVSGVGNLGTNAPGGLGTTPATPSVNTSAPGATDSSSLTKYDGQNNPPFLVLNYIIKT